MRISKKAVLVTSLGALALIAVPALLSAQGVMFIKNNKVGIGIDTPTELLHVKSTDGGTNTLSFVENTVGNNRVGARFKNGVSTWDFRTDGLGDFIFDEGSTGGQELKVRKNGSVIMGPGGTQQFVLSPTGNLTIAGTLTQGSSRSIKENLATMDSGEVLGKVMSIPVLGWSYTNQGARHVGPMAEDFYAAFGLGESDKTLAPGDVAGVALVALQGLNAEIQSRDSQIEKLERELAELRALVESLAAN